MKTYQFISELSDINSELSKEIKSFISEFDVDERSSFTTYAFEKTVSLVDSENENFVVSFKMISNDELEIIITYPCYDEDLNLTGEIKTVSDMIRGNLDKNKVMNLLDKLLHQI